MPRRKGDYCKAFRRDSRQLAWQSMRILKQFTRPQIETVAQIRKDNFGRFIRPLARCGYLQCVKEHVSGSPGSYKIWRLIRNSGPNRPIPREDGRVFDPNTKKVYGQNGEETHD